VASAKQMIGLFVETFFQSHFWCVSVCMWFRYSLHCNTRNNRNSL